MRSQSLTGTLCAWGLAAFALCLTACSPAKPANPQAAAAVQAARQQRRAEQQAETAYSQDLDQIPPPAKSRYMRIHKLKSWSNPFLIIRTHTVTLRVSVAGMPGPPGPMPHPRVPKWHTAQLQLADLPEALAALPEESWPYGRVIAVEDDPSATRQQRVQVRRNEEATLKVLNDMGVVVYEWPGNGPAL
jgi:hypothetical protein